MSGLMEAILAGARQQAENERQPEPKIKVDLDAALVTLAEFNNNYTNRVGRFAVGDVITPRKGTAYRSAGNPHMVCEVIDPPLRFTGADPSSHKYGMDYDLRVMTMYDDIVTCFTVESWAFDPWTKEMMPDDA